MQFRDFGNTGMRVSEVGFGAGHIGEDWRDENSVANILNTALDLGINLIDTARFYGLSEERIGRHLNHRRDEYFLSTKIGYGVEGVADWSPEIMSAGIERALRVCRTDRIDIVHLHSCGLKELSNNDMIDALIQEKQEGKVRYLAYSGENDALDFAINLGVFDSFQCSVNLVDQFSMHWKLSEMIKAGAGVIAKRPVANMAWRFDERPSGEYAEVYWTRLQDMKLDDIRDGMDWLEFALRFSLTVTGVHSCIIGTGNADHLKHNVELADKGPLPTDMFTAVCDRFNNVGQGWNGEV